MYPYEPVGECIAATDDQITVWSHVRTTRCCQYALKSLSQALALEAADSQEIFLSEERIRNCSSVLHAQNSFSLSSCGLDNLLREGGKCSNLTMSSFKNSSYHDRFSSVISNCSQFDAPNFYSRCGACTQEISNMIDYVVSDLQVKDNDTENMMCSIATVIAVASSGIRNKTFVGELYRCLPAMDSIAGTVC